MHEVLIWPYEHSKPIAYMIYFFCFNCCHATARYQPKKKKKASHYEDFCNYPAEDKSSQNDNKKSILSPVRVTQCQRVERERRGRF